MRKLDCIRENIDKDLPKLPVILDNVLRHVLGKDHSEGETFVLGHGAKDILHLLEEVPQLEGTVHQLELTSLKLLEFLIY